MKRKLADVDLDFIEVEEFKNSSLDIYADVFIGLIYIELGVWF
jgi:hypothetical protein